MPSTILTSQVIANELLMRFQNKLGFSSSIKHAYDKRFATSNGNYGKPGDTVSVRAALKLAATKGAAITPQDVEYRKVDIKIDQQAVVPWQFNLADLTLKLDDFSRQNDLDSAAQALANLVDCDGLTMAYQATFNTLGTPGTTPTAIKTYQQASAWLSKMGAPIGGNDRFVVYNPDMEVEIVNVLLPLQESAPEIRWQYEKGRMRSALGLNWLIDQNIRTHVTGSMAGTPTVVSYSNSGTGAQARAALATTAWPAATAGVLKKGDTIQIVGRYAVNPVTGDTLGDLKSWVVSADVTTVGSGVCTIYLTEPIEPIGPYKNVSSAPVLGDLIRCYGVVAPHTTVLSKSSPQALVYDRRAFALAMVPMVQPADAAFKAVARDPETGMSLRIWSASDIMTDMMITRVDALYGWASLIPEWSCRVLG